MEGSVLDPSGSTVAQASVTAANNRTGVSVSTKTDAFGRFIFASLPPSFYTLTVEAAGFRKYLLANVELNASAISQHIVRLELGAVAETVTVEDTPVKVNTADAQTGRTVALKDIDTLPQLNRSPMALAIYTTGVSADPGSTSFARVNGLRQGANNVRLDGIDANDSVVPRFGLNMVAVNTDSVEEMRVITNGGKAEYGRNAGGQIELVSRGGTNKFHGNAFEYLRNTQLNANRFFSNASGLTRPKFIQNIFGGSFGGPVIREKTFFHVNYQGLRRAQEVERNRTVYTQEGRNGIFRWRAPGSSEIQSFNIPAADPKGRGLDSVARDIIAISPLPNNFDLGDGLNTGGFRFNNPVSTNTNQGTARVDHHLTEAHRLFFRFSRSYGESTDNLNNGDALFPGRPGGVNGGPTLGYSIGSDWTLRPTIINEFRFGHQSGDTFFTRPDRPQGLGVAFNVITNPINLAFASVRNSPVYDFTDNVTWVKGRHIFKFGGNYRHTRQWSSDDNSIYPNASLARTGAPVPAGVGPSGGVISSLDRQAFEDHYNNLLGRVANIQTIFYGNLNEFQAAGTPRVRNHLFKDFSLFVQDDWKVMPGLTINVGLRYEVFGAPYERDGILGRLDRPELVNTVSQVSDFQVTRASRWHNTDRNNFAPRIGFSWDPSRNGKLSIRGSYGVYYDRFIGSTANLVDRNTPGFSQLVRNDAGLAYPQDTRLSENPPLPARPGSVSVQQPVTRQASVVSFDPNLRTGYVQQFNFSIQREMARNLVVEAGYVGTRGVKLFNWYDANQPRIYGDFLTSLRELDNFRANGVAPSPSNTLVRIFGTPQAAITGLGATTVAQGLAGTAADQLDLINFNRYGAAGVSQHYLRNFPQYNLVLLGNNVGSSNYNGLQMTVRRQSGDLRWFFNYTFSKALDNISEEGNGYSTTTNAVPIDNYNMTLNRGRGDFDRTHLANWNVIYALPIGTGKWIGGDMPTWANKILGGWEIGALGLWQSGTVFTVTSNRRTGPSTVNAFANYTGDRTIGSVDRQGGGVWYFTPEQRAAFSFPSFGEIGTSGRNAFRGPSFFNLDLSMVKSFGLPWEGHRVQFRAEMYNAFNHANFAVPGLNAALQTFGRISATVGEARVMQMALRYDF